MTSRQVNMKLMDDYAARNSCRRNVLGLWHKLGMNSEVIIKLAAIQALAFIELMQGF